jgi:putative ABC transport system ATP-binding protein
MVENIVQTINLSKTYKRKNIEVVALKDVSLQISKAQIVCIMGPSGSGKTTLLNIIGGVDRPTSGNVIIGDIDITKFGESQITRFRLEKIGFVFQFYNLFQTLTASENVELPLILAKKPKQIREKRVDDLLEIVGMKQRANHKPDELSGGEQQRVAIARALVNDPTLILADEPTGDLDSENAVAFMELVKELNKKQNQTFLIVTHDPLVSNECDKIYAIRDGRLSEK